MRRSLIAVGLTAGLVMVPMGATATAPPPFLVTQAGVELTAGTFGAHGHLNIRITDAAGNVIRHQNTHFDPYNNQPGGAFIGQSFMPVELAPGECIGWVQWDQTNYHFGENGELPVCMPITPTPTPTPEPTPTPTPTVPSPEPTPTPTVPAPSPSPESPTPTPSTPAPTPTPTPTPSTTPTVTPTPTPSTTPSDAQPSQKMLAVTGENLWGRWALLLGGGLLLLGMGIFALVTRGRR